MRKHLATILVLILTTAGIAACGGGDDDDQSSGSESTDKTQVETDDSSDTTDAPAAGDLADLLERQQDAVIKITYKRGDDEFTIAQDHEKRAITTDNSKVIVTDDGTINCSDIDTTPTCLDVPAGVDSLVNVGLSFYNVIAQSLADASGTLPGLETTQDKVAGRDATCTEADSSTFLQGLTDSISGLELPSMSARVCVDNETGFLLEFSTDRDATDNLVAIEITEPTAADFEPVVPLTELPDDAELPGDEPS